LKLDTIGANIRKCRLAKKLRQEDLAEKTNLSVTYIGMIERGEKTPALETLINILNALGVSAELEADIFYPEISQGDFVLLCTDGLTNVVSDQEILFEVIHGGDIENCCGRMLDIAIQRGAPDNITALLLEK